MKTIYVAATSFDSSMVQNRATRVRYNIGVGWNEVIEIHGIRIRADIVQDQNIELQWKLIAKDESVAFTSASVTAPNADDNDNDMLIRGWFQNYLDASSRKEDNPHRETVWFPIPFVIPRSPSLELVDTAGSINLKVASEVYYTKKIVSRLELAKVVKRFYGRKQIPVHNVPPTIDE